MAGPYHDRGDALDGRISQRLSTTEASDTEVTEIRISCSVFSVFVVSVVSG